MLMNICDRVTSMAVDSASDVNTLSLGQIKVTPEMDAALDINYLIGLGALGERMLSLFDIGRLMSSKEIGLIEKLAT